jgi:NTP pyrophosphatase (non-canonical NTP hydrolase)
MNRLQYLFGQLAEEACEVAQAASKCNRFTINMRYQNGPTNLEQLSTEIRDLMTVLSMVEDELKVELDKSVSPDKIAKVERYILISKDLGVLS